MYFQVISKQSVQINCRLSFRKDGLDRSLLLYTEMRINPFIFIMRPHPSFQTIKNNSNQTYSWPRACCLSAPWELNLGHPLKTIGLSHHYCTEGFKEGPKLGCHYSKGVSCLALSLMVKINDSRPRLIPNYIIFFGFFSRENLIQKCQPVHFYIFFCPNLIAKCQPVPLKHHREPPDSKLELSILIRMHFVDILFW